MYHSLLSITDWAVRAQEAKYRIHSLAKNSGVCVRTMERFIQHRFKLSPRAWLMPMRMRRAVELLKCGTNLKTVGPEVGYLHAHHFSREFTKYIGCFPSNCCHCAASINGYAKCRVLV